VLFSRSPLQASREKGDGLERALSATARCSKALEGPAQRDSGSGSCDVDRTPEAVSEDAHFHWGLQSPASFSDSHRVGLACMHAILVTMGTLY